MTPDNEPFLPGMFSSLNEATADLGFGITMGIITVVLIIRQGGRRDRFSVMFLFSLISFLGMCFASWAGRWHFGINLEAARLLALVAICAVAALVIIASLSKHPPYAFAALVVCLIFAAAGMGAWMMFYALVAVGIVVIFLALAWANVRMAESAALQKYIDRPIENRRLPAQDRIRLPAKR